MPRHVPFDIVIPPLGDRSVGCQLSQWLVAIGDFVKEGEPLLILETEKTAIEIPAPADGTLTEVFVYEGEEVIEEECVGVIRAEFYDDDEEEGYEDDESDDEADDDDDDEDDDYDDEEEEDDDGEFEEEDDEYDESLEDEEI